MLSAALRSHAPRTTARKVLYVLYGALLLVSTLLIAWLHTGQVRTLQAEAHARMGGITGTLAAQLDGARVQRLLARYDSQGMLTTNTQDAWYYVLHGSLRKVREANGLASPIHILAYDTTSAALQYVVSSETTPVLRIPFEGPAQHAISEYLLADRVDPERGQWGTVVASFDAVRNDRGSIIGAVYTEIQLSVLDAQARSRLWRNIGAAAFAFLLFGIFLFRSVGRMVQREEDARDLWQRKHEGISDSIAYAGKIQDALIPRAERYREMFPDHFVLNKPKDVVSGDFHWYHRLAENECLVAAADCTGHGLPGAMMAAIGCSLLNELVVQHPYADPAELLGVLNERMVQALNQSGQRFGAGDGMDIALCRIDRARSEILFAGAFRPLYWMHEGQLTVINGDRKPIGGSQHDAKRKFTVHRLAYQPGDRVYLFSDGYVDQFGGPERKKFMSARFNDMLVAHHERPMQEQAEVLERAFLDWKGQNEQVDDVCVVGLMM